MKTLTSHVAGRWHEAREGFVELIDPCSEEPIARASSAGLDVAAALGFARDVGGSALRRLDLAGRAELLAAMSKALHERREELIDLSVRNTGTTRKDAKFDIDGATFTLSHYARLGAALAPRRFLLDGDGVQLGRSPRFWGQHVLLPRRGAAVLINAFNFPAWGIAEKAACAILAGMPVLAKPATSSALVAHRCVEILVEAEVLPPGALSLICGGTGRLLDLLGEDDVLAFTGSAATALGLRSKTNLLSASTRVNVEADSLNAAVLGPEVEPGSETWQLFARDVVREMTQKTGQKCTAVRRIFVPQARLAAVRDALAEPLAAVVTGNPQDAAVTMGPLASASQLGEALEGIERLRAEAGVVVGRAERCDGVGNPAGRGFFLAPVLLEGGRGLDAVAVHEHEVFGPVATLLTYDGSAEEAARGVALARGSLVTSVYSDDAAFLQSFVIDGGASSGRVYIGSEKVAAQLPGSGLAMPDLLHGGAGRAGGGEELGGLRGLSLYLQRVALGGDRALVERIAGTRARE